MLNVGTEGA